MNRERAVLLAAFGFMSKEAQRVWLTVRDIDPVKKPFETKVIRLLQKLELKIGKNYLEDQKFVNMKISEINKKIEIGTINDALVGIGILMNYKDNFKGKKVGRGLNYNDINDIYDHIEKSAGLKLVNNSFRIADDLYSRLTQSDVRKTTFRVER